MSWAAFGQAKDESAALRYIEQYKQLAMQEQNRVGIPAAITLAQGLLESQNGASILASEANNHFGIKCKNNWTGETILHDDDAMSECFRKYKTAFDSYKDHSDFLKNNRRYAFLFDLPLTKYQDWAIGLRKAGYATDPSYSTKLIQIIERFKLAEYTLEAEKNRSAEDIAAAEKRKQEELMAEQLKREEQEKKIAAKKAKDSITKANKLKRIAKEKNPDEMTAAVTTKAEIDETEFILNGLKGFYAKKGDMLLQEAVNRNIRYAKLLQLNDLKDEPLAEDMFIYLEKKNKKSPNKRVHVVRAGESMIGIAQLEGLQLSSLQEMNALEENEMPVPGTRLYLQETTTQKPQLVNVKLKPAPVVAPKPATTTEVVKRDDENIGDLIFKNDSKDANTAQTNTKESENKETTTLNKIENAVNKDVLPEVKEAVTNTKENAINTSKENVQVEATPTTTTQDNAELTTRNEVASNTINLEKGIKDVDIQEAQRALGEEVSGSLEKKDELVEETNVAINNPSINKEAPPQTQTSLAKNTASKVKSGEKVQAKEDASKLSQIAPVNTPTVNTMPVTVIKEEIIELPKPKSPSTYSEAGVSPELHRLKRIMDDIVYAAPMPKKKVVTVTPSPTATKPVTTNTKPGTTTPKPNTTNTIVPKPNSVKPASTSSVATKPTLNAKPNTVKKDSIAQKVVKPTTAPISAKGAKANAPAPSPNTKVADKKPITKLDAAPAKDAKATTKATTPTAKDAKAKPDAKATTTNAPKAAKPNAKADAKPSTIEKDKAAAKEAAAKAAAAKATKPAPKKTTKEKN
jgi:hypothetical protein